MLYSALFRNVTVMDVIEQLNKCKWNGLCILQITIAGHNNVVPCEDFKSAFA